MFYSSHRASQDEYPRTSSHTLPVFLSQVLDGDTIVVSKEGLSRTIRLIGIKSFNPNSDQKSERFFATLASEAIRRRIGNNPVTIITKGNSDRSGKLIARIEHEEQDLGAYLLEKGMVMLFPAFDFNELDFYQRQQSDAIKNNRGFWQDNDLKKIALLKQKMWSKQNVK